MASTSLAFDIFARDRGAERTFDRVGRSAEHAGKRFHKVGIAAGAAGRAMAKGLAVGGAATATGLGYAVSKAATFEKTMNQLQVATDASSAKMEQFTKLALDMGAKTVFSAQDAAASMLELSKGGLDAATIQAGALNSTMTLAAAGGVDLANAATYMSNAMNAFGIKGRRAMKVTTALAGAANASTASVESLGLGLAQAGLASKNAGLSLQETTAALAALDNAGIKGSDAGTALKTFLINLVPTTDKAQAAFDQLGLSLVKRNGDFKSLADITAELTKATDDLSESEKIRLTKQAFGQDAFRTALALADAGKSKIEAYTRATNDQTKAQDMANASMKGAAGAMEAFKGSIETLAIQLGTRLLPKFTAVTNWLAKNLPKAFDAAQPALNALSAWVSDTAVPAFKRFWHWVQEKLIPAFQQFSDDTWPAIRSNLADMKDSVEGVGSAFKQLSDDTGDTNDKVSALGKTLQATTWFFAKMVQDVAQTIEWILWAVDHIVNAFKSLASTFGKLSKIGFGGGNPFSKYADAFGGLLDWHSGPDSGGAKQKKRSGSRPMPLPPASGGTSRGDRPASEHAERYLKDIRDSVVRRNRADPLTAGWGAS